MTAPRNEVDAWFAKYDNPMKPVVQRVRELMLAADPRLGECIKWQAPTFTYQGNLASFFPKSKQHASLMFHEGARIPGKHPRLEGGGATGRLIKLASVAEANAARADLTRLVKAWCDWRDAEAKKPAKRTTKPKPARATSKKKEDALASNLRVLSFTATECGSQPDEDGVLCGASNSKSKQAHHTFIVFGEPSRTGDRAYFELEDQSQGDTGLISRVECSATSARFVLERGQRTVPFDVVEVTLPAKGRAAFFKGLGQVLGRRVK